jgi:hypothetical protein
LEPKAKTTHNLILKRALQFGFEANLYHEDPGFGFSEGWQRHLRAACNDLMDIKQAKVLKALRK